jgi:hypothetical protein
MDRSGIRSRSGVIFRLIASPQPMYVPDNVSESRIPQLLPT